jgi:hypothetical protein
VVHPADKLRADLEAKKIAAAAAKSKASDNVAPPKSPVKKKKAKGGATEESSTKPKIARRKRGASPKAEKSVTKAASKGNGKTQSKKSKKVKGGTTEKAEKVTSNRSLDRDKTDKGDGLRPIERRIIEVVADNSEPTNIKEMALLIFGEDCGSEGPDSGRTIRNAARMPIKYGVLESAGRGQLKVTAAYKRAKGDLVKLMKSYRARMKKVTDTAEASA